MKLWLRDSAGLSGITQFQRSPTAEQRTRRTIPSSTGRNEDNEADSRIIAGKIIIKRIKAVTTLFVGINKFLLMKIIFLFFFRLICCSITDAQTDSIIYYRKALQSETDDNEKVDIMNRLGFKYLFTKVDSSLYYGQEALSFRNLRAINRGNVRL